MIRFVDLVLIGAMIAGATWTFQIKHQAEVSTEKSAKLSRSINAEQERINLLRADWALFNTPERLQNLTEQFSDDLELKPLRPEQIATIGELPEIKPVTVEDEDYAAGDETDATTTGGIKHLIKRSDP